MRAAALAFFWLRRGLAMEAAWQSQRASWPLTSAAAILPIVWLGAWLMVEQLKKWPFPPVRLVLLALVLASSCSVESSSAPDRRNEAGDGAAGSGGAAAEPGQQPASAALSIVGEPALRLGFGDTARLTVKLVNSS